MTYPFIGADICGAGVQLRSRTRNNNIARGTTRADKFYDAGAERSPTLNDDSSIRTWRANPNTIWTCGCYAVDDGWSNILNVGYATNVAGIAGQSI